MASLETFDRMEDKANRMLDSAMAEAELSADMDAGNDLVNKYVSGESSSTVDDESKTRYIICRTCRNVSDRFFFAQKWMTRIRKKRLSEKIPC